ncbi:MAG: Sca4 family protein [Rickettsiaceae bacterium]|nr:Sca4 family protein [Rickettsiaceae bacterium]
MSREEDTTKPTIFELSKFKRGKSGPSNGKSGSDTVTLNDVKYQLKSSDLEIKVASKRALKDSSIVREYIASNISDVLSKSINLNSAELSPEVSLVTGGTNNSHIYIASRYIRDGVGDLDTASPKYLGVKKRRKDKSHVGLVLLPKDASDAHIKALNELGYVALRPGYTTDVKDTNISHDTLIKDICQSIALSALSGDHDLNPGNLILVSHQKTDQTKELRVARIDYGHGFNDLLFMRKAPKDIGIIDYFNRTKLPGFGDAGVSKLWRDYEGFVPSEQLAQALAEVSKNPEKYKKALKETESNLTNYSGKLEGNPKAQKRFIKEIKKMTKQMEQMGIQINPVDPDPIKNYFAHLDKFYEKRFKEMQQAADLMRAQARVDELILEGKTAEQVIEEIKPTYAETTSQKWFRAEKDTVPISGTLIDYVTQRINQLQDRIYLEQTKGAQQSHEELIQQQNTWVQSNSADHEVKWRSKPKFLAKASNGVQTSKATIKDASNKKILEIKQTQYTESITIQEDLGIIKYHRFLDIPMTIKKGPENLFCRLTDFEGKPLDNAPYFTIHYNKKGLLENITFPKPVTFTSESKDAIGYVEVNGTKYTIPFSRGKYEEMMHQVGREKELGEIVNHVADKFKESKASTLSTITTFLADVSSYAKNEQKEEKIDLSGISAIEGYRKLVQNLDIKRDTVRGVRRYKIGDKEPYTIIRDARGMKDEDTIGSEAYLIQYAHAIIAANEVIENDASIPNKDEAKQALNLKFKENYNAIQEKLNELNADESLSSKQKEAKLQSFVSNIIASDVIVILEQNKVKDAHKKLTFAKDLASLSYEQGDVVTVSKGQDENTSIIQAEVGLRTLTSEQRAEYEIIKAEKGLSPLWFSKMPQWKQEIVKAHAKDILNGKILSSQCKYLPGTLNASEQITGVYKKGGSVQILSAVKHSGALAVFTGNKAEDRRLADMNAQQVKLWGGTNKVTLNVLNSRANIDQTDHKIVDEAERLSKEEGIDISLNPINIFRFIASKNLKGAEKILVELAQALERSDDENIKKVAEYLKSGKDYNIVAGLDFSELSYHEQLIVKYAIRLKYESSKGFMSRNNLSISNNLNLLINNINLQKEEQEENKHTIDLSNISQEILLSCKSGKDRTGFVLFATGSKALEDYEDYQSKYPEASSSNALTKQELKEEEVLLGNSGEEEGIPNYRPQIALARAGHQQYINGSSCHGGGSPGAFGVKEIVLHLAGMASEVSAKIGPLLMPASAKGNNYSSARVKRMIGLFESLPSKFIKTQERGGTRESR